MVYGHVARKSSRPKSCRPKPELCRPIFIVMSPEILSCVIHRKIKLDNAKQCRNQHVLFVSNNKFCAASTKTIDDSDRTQLSALILTCAKCFATCSSVRLIHWKTQNILVRSSYFENCLWQNTSKYKTKTVRIVSSQVLQILGSVFTRTMRYSRYR